MSDVAILVVEDDAPNLKLMGLLLTQGGGRVHLAATGEEALAALHEFHPDVLLVDLLLPRMSGLTLIHEVKANPAYRDTAIVAVTSLNDAEVQRMVMEAGCVGYLRKPFEAATVAIAVAGFRKIHLSRSKARDPLP